MSTSEGWKVTQGLTALMKVNFLRANFQLFHPDIEITLGPSMYTHSAQFPFFHILRTAYPRSKRILADYVKEKGRKERHTLLVLSRCTLVNKDFAIL